jgi:hypothetical protein
MNTPITPEATYNNGLNNGAYPISFEMKGNWDDEKELPEEGAEVGHCYIWKGHFWARNSLGKWVDYGDLSQAGIVQALFLQDHRQSACVVVFRKVERPDVTVNVCWDFGTREIAERYVPKEGKPDQAYLADGSIFLWAEWKGEWVEDGKIGDVWEPAPPPTSEKFLRELYMVDVRANYPGTFEEWCKQNGDLNALLRMATAAAKSTPVTIPGNYHLPVVTPAPGKDSEQAISEKEHPSLDDVSKLLESGLSKLEGEQSDVALKALDALKKVKVDLRRKRRNTWLRWMLFWVILGAIGYGLYKWVPTQVVTGRYTVSKTCSAPFGNGTIQGMRYYNYTYKSLFGVHFTLESTVREETDVSKDGKEFTVFGLSPRNEAATEEEMALADKVLKTAEVDVEAAPKPPKGKWWRINVWPSDKGTQWMKPAELYLFASEKYTTMVAYKDFCK